MAILHTYARKSIIYITPLITVRIPTAVIWLYPLLLQYIPAIVFDQCVGVWNFIFSVSGLPLWVSIVLIGGIGLICTSLVRLSFTIIGAYMKERCIDTMV